MKERRSRKLSTQILRITLIPTMSIFGLSVLITSMLVVRERDREFQDLLRTEGRLRTERFEGVFSRTVDRLRLLASSPIVRQAPMSEVLDYLRSEEDRLSTEVEGLYFNTLAGDVTGTRGQSFSIADRDYFWHDSPGASIFTGMLRSRGTKNLIFLALEPIAIEGGNYRGYLGATIDLSRLQGFAADEPGTGRVYLVDAARQVYSLREKGELPNSAFVLDVLKKSQGEVSFHQIDGREWDSPTRY